MRFLSITEKKKQICMESSFFLNFHRKNNKNDIISMDNKYKYYLISGPVMALGVMIGTAIGASIGNIKIGVSFGLLFGTVLAHWQYS